MAGRNRDIQQIRFLDGTEVLANILFWEEDTLIEANNILEMLTMEDMEHPNEDRSYYMLKPLVMYTDDVSKKSMINPNSIMTVTKPSDTVIAQYTASLAEIVHAMEGDLDGESPSNVVAFDSKKKLLTED